MKRSYAALLHDAACRHSDRLFSGGPTYSAQESRLPRGVCMDGSRPSLIVGLFKDGIRIYEPYNTGWWYDFGFYIAVIAGFGGIALTRRKKKGSRQS
jgi:hypothetical protein